MPFAYPERSRLKAEIIARVDAGDLLKTICAEPGIPSDATLLLWKRAGLRREE